MYLLTVIGLSGLNLNLFSYQYQTQFYVTLENCIANKNNWPYHGIEIQSAIYTVFVTTLVLRNVSITNNNMTGLAAKQGLVHWCLVNY